MNVDYRTEAQENLAFQSAFPLLASIITVTAIILTCAGRLYHLPSRIMFGSSLVPGVVFVPQKYLFPSHMPVCNTKASNNSGVFKVFVAAFPSYRTPAMQKSE